MPENVRYLLVDGHSVIFAWPELRVLHQSKTSLARQELTSRLQRLHDAAIWQVTLVFDGRYGAPPLRREDEMIVAYSSENETADSVIERLVASHSQKGSITVITSDEMERQTVEALGAQTASAEWLKHELASQEIYFRQKLDQVNRKARW